jgi:hypothetical protein
MEQTQVSKVSTKLGYDLGKGFHKACYADESSNERFIDMPSYYSHGKLSAAMPGRSHWSEQISYGGVNYVFGEFSHLGERFTINDAEIKNTEINLAMVLSILARLNVRDADILVGLPISTFLKEKDSLRALLNGVFEASFHKQKEPITFNIKADVIQEPLGSYMAMVLYPDGTISNNEFFNRLIGIVDIGHTTVDIVGVEKGQLTANQKSGLYGISNIYNAIWRELEPRFGMIKANEKVQFMKDVTMRFGSATMKIDGHTVNPIIWGKIKDMKAALAKTIIDDAKSTLSDLRPNYWVFTGGGSAFLKDEITSLFGQPTFLENPRFANAQGFYRFLKYRERAKK